VQSRTLPDFSGNCPTHVSSSVVFPAPFGPSMQQISPGSTVNSTSCNTVMCP